MGGKVLYYILYYILYYTPAATWESMGGKGAGRRKFSKVSALVYLPQDATMQSTFENLHMLGQLVCGDGGQKVSKETHSSIREHFTECVLFL